MEELDIKELQKAIIAKVWKDESLRTEFVQHPKEAIERELGIKVPESLNLKIIDQAEDATYLLLPHHPKNLLCPNNKEMEFTDEQLETIAGGISGNPMEDVDNTANRWVAEGTSKLAGQDISYHHDHEGGSFDMPYQTARDLGLA